MRASSSLRASQHRGDDRMEQSLRVLIVEDDVYQIGVLSHLIGKADTLSGVSSSLQIAANGADAVRLCEEASFDLVLLDYLLPGGDGAQILPQVRKTLGKKAAIAMVSSSQQESPMIACLKLGADTYRVKPLAITHIAELLAYTVQKRAFLQKRRRLPSRSPSRSPSRERPDPAVDMSPDMILAYGRRSAVYIAMASSAAAPPPSEDATSSPTFSPADSAPVAVKVGQMASVRGPPPPPHPHVNSVIKRTVEPSFEPRTGVPLVTCYEQRALCECEFFDTLISEGSDPKGQPLATVVARALELADAIAHCHAHGAVHGQLHPENVLLMDGKALQLVGFYCCAPPLPADEDAPPVDEAGPAVGPAPSEVAEVELRPSHPLDAPELRDRSHAPADELAACDVWSLGVLVLWLLTGAPATTLPARLVAPSPARATIKGSVPLERGLSGISMGGLSSSSTEVAATDEPISRGTQTDATLASLAGTSACGRRGGSACSASSVSSSDGATPSQSSNAGSANTGSSNVGSVATAHAPPRAKPTTATGPTSPSLTASLTGTGGSLGASPGPTPLPPMPAQPAVGWQQRTHAAPPTLAPTSVDVSDVVTKEPPAVSTTTPPRSATGVAMDVGAGESPTGAVGGPERPAATHHLGMPPLPALLSLLTAMLDHEPRRRPSSHAVLASLRQMAPAAEAAVRMVV